MKAICCVNNGFYIGNQGKLMWKSKDDLQHFRTKTMGGICIVGATTFEKDLNQRRLPGRELIVIGNPNKNPEYKSLSNAVKLAYYRQLEDNKKNIWVIGGASIYQQLLPLCDELHLSYIDDDQVGDVKFNPSFRGKIITYNFNVD